MIYYTSTKTQKQFCKMGPQKSICNRANGFEGHCHRLKQRLLWRFLSFLACCTQLHHIFLLRIQTWPPSYICSQRFIFEMPEFSLSSILTTGVRQGRGTTTWQPQRVQSSTSCFCCSYGFNSGFLIHATLFSLLQKWLVLCLSIF